MTFRILPLFFSAAVLLMAAGCEQPNIYAEIDYNVTLAPSNTYVAGEPVVFNITGNPDNLLFYSGEPGHRYEYRDRYQTTADHANAMRLELSIQHRQGNSEALEIYYSDSFEELSGNPETDRTRLEEMYAGGMEGWTEIEFDDPGGKKDVYFDVDRELPKELASNFCLAFYWCPPEPEDVVDGENITYPHTYMDTYYVNGTLYVDIDGVEMSYKLQDIMGQTFQTDPRVDQPYVNTVNQNGRIRLNAQQDIVFSGAYYDAIQHYCTGWAFSAPRAFLSIDPDEGIVVKNLQNYLDTYEYTFEEPGTYTVTFVGTNVNYQGSSSQVKELTVTVVNPPLQTEPAE